jgi:hypothetical protein
MKRIRLLVPVLALLLALLPSSAIASTPTTYQESVLGIETGPPQSTATCPTPNSVSSFAGIARGTLSGVFGIAVCHTPLDHSATILGGAFTVSNGTTSVTGSFARGGTVSYVSMIVIDSLCIQKYAVSGGLLPSPGHFTGKLVHYGFWTGRSCSVFFATISGSAELTG